MDCLHFLTMLRSQLRSVSVQSYHFLKTGHYCFSWEKGMAVVAGVKAPFTVQKQKRRQKPQFCSLLAGLPELGGIAQDTALSSHSCCIKGL